MPPDCHRQFLTPIGSPSLASQIWSSWSQCSLLLCLVFRLNPGNPFGKPLGVEHCLPGYLKVKGGRPAVIYTLTLCHLGNPGVSFRNNQDQPRQRGAFPATAREGGTWSSTASLVPQNIHGILIFRAFTCVPCTAQPQDLLLKPKIF